MVFRIKKKTYSYYVQNNAAFIILSIVPAVNLEVYNHKEKLMAKEVTNRWTLSALTLNFVEGGFKPIIKISWKPDLSYCNRVMT